METDWNASGSAPEIALRLQACGICERISLMKRSTEAPSADRLRSKSKNSPFDGRRLQGEIRMTLVDGRVVYRV